MTLENLHRYDDIIDLPHHRSTKHRHMSNLERAVQFMPFAALKGHDERVREVSSTPCTRIALADDERETLNDRLVEVIGQLESHPYASITYFQPEGGRDAGEYMTAIRPDAQGHRYGGWHTYSPGEHRGHSLLSRHEGALRSRRRIRACL